MQLQLAIASDPNPMPSPPPFSFQTIAFIPVSSKSANNAASKLSLNQEDGGGHHTLTDCVLPLQYQVWCVFYLDMLG